MQRLQPVCGMRGMNIIASKDRTWGDWYRPWSLTQGEKKIQMLTKFFRPMSLIVSKSGFILDPKEVAMVHLMM
jgi:hypothetical protein